eukprot:ANDGO_01328.mRNA.1 hypothetical protein
MLTFMQFASCSDKLRCPVCEMSDFAFGFRDIYQNPTSADGITMSLSLLPAVGFLMITDPEFRTVRFQTNFSAVAFYELDFYVNQARFMSLFLNTEDPSWMRVTYVEPSAIPTFRGYSVLPQTIIVWFQSHLTPCSRSGVAYCVIDSISKMPGRLAFDTSTNTGMITCGLSAGILLPGTISVSASIGSIQAIGNAGSLQGTEIVSIDRIQPSHAPVATNGSVVIAVFGTGFSSWLLPSPGGLLCRFGNDISFPVVFVDHVSAVCLVPLLLADTALLPYTVDVTLVWNDHLITFGGNATFTYDVLPHHGCLSKCSSHAVCDGETGSCVCEGGYIGSTCDIPLVAIVIVLGVITRLCFATIIILFIMILRQKRLQLLSDNAERSPLVSQTVQ